MALVVKTARILNCLQPNSQKVKTFLRNINKITFPLWSISLQKNHCNRVLHTFTAKHHPKSLTTKVMAFYYTKTQKKYIKVKKKRKKSTKKQIMSAYADRSKTHFQRFKGILFLYFWGKITSKLTKTFVKNPKNTSKMVQWASQRR